ncbi:BA75_00498T0 [Komagataella pastoris]|uniref:O-acyltransferase n=1 Tax=Komagataella pastoris TaxID=4922 RepID=A0A1B2J674_PICPA|nr:BA75_00498T0 [Komagataella pastoris]
MMPIPVARVDSETQMQAIKRNAKKERSKIHNFPSKSQEIGGSMKGFEEDLKEYDIMEDMKSHDLVLIKKNAQISNRYDKKGELRSRFGDISFNQSRSIFDSSIMDTSFRGFFILAWMAVGMLALKTLVEYERNNTRIYTSNIIRIMRKDLIKVGFADLLMYLSMYATFFLQKLIKNGYLDWDNTGMYLQHIYQCSFLFFWLLTAKRMEFPWIGKIFLLLHSLVMLMKMHSYAFYNGYLFKIQKELEFSQRHLKNKKQKLDKETSAALQKSVEFCKFELASQSTTSPFPSNVNLKNWFWYTMYPTVVYEIDYPLTNEIRWEYVGTKMLGIFGVIFLMILVAESWLYPLALEAIQLRKLPVSQRVSPYIFILLEMAPPFLLMYMLVFYLIWELILNAVAELTGFADRSFYSEWWNSVSWDEFARDWNLPVHRFLLRHVYHSSISAFQLSRYNATLFTFLLSSFVHELTMYVIFGKFRGYLLYFQMAQIPLTYLSRTKFMADRKILGNSIFWLGISTGPSLLCSLYLVF